MHRESSEDFPLRRKRDCDVWLGDSAGCLHIALLPFLLGRLAAESGRCEVARGLQRRHVAAESGILRSPMAYVVRRLQRMDLSFFYAYGSNAAGHQRAINIDGWLMPAIGTVPPSVHMRYRHIDDAAIRVEPRLFGRLEKNFRLHGQMVPGNGYLRYGRGDLMLMRISGDHVTWAIFKDDAADRPVYSFLNDGANVLWRRNMGLVRDRVKIRTLEALLGQYDAALFFSDEMNGLDEEPKSAVVRRALRRVMTPEQFAALQRAWERNGGLGERFVVERERARLAAAGRRDLADRVEHVSETDPTSPYDVRSFEGGGPEPDADRYIEVKSTSGSGMEFEMSEAEWIFAEDKRHEHMVYRVTRVTDETPECVEVRDIVGRFLANPSMRRPVSFKVRIV
jgi:hypothetical protein